MSPRWRLRALTALAVPLLAACLDPTQIEVVVTTDVDCQDDQQAPRVWGTGITFGLPQALEESTLGVESATCEPEGDSSNNYIGSVVAVPSGERDDSIAIRVVTAVEVPLSACRPPDYGKHCIVARRAMRYIEHSSLRVPIVMRESCLGVQCDPFETCVDGFCVPSELDPGECTGSDGCGEIILPQPIRPVGPAGTLGAQLPLTDDPGASLEPRMLWTGSEYALVWTDDRFGDFDVLFNRLDSAGGKIQQDTPVVQLPGAHLHPSVAQRPGGYWIANDQQVGSAREAWVWQAEGDGVPGVEGGTPIPGERSPVVAFNGQEGLLATVYDGTIRVRLSSPGIFPVSPFEIASQGGLDADAPSVAAAAEGFAVAWEDVRDGDPEIYLARVLGGVPGPPIRITNAPGSSSEPSLVASVGGFGLAWSDRRVGDAEIYFALLDANGQKVGHELRITHAAGVSADPTLVWTGSEFGLSWRDDRDGNDEIYFVRIDPLGGRTNELRVTDDGRRSVEPTLSWSGQHFGLVWADDQDGDFELYFVTITP